MIEITGLLAMAGIVIFIGFLGEYIFEKTSIPDVIWLMLLGLLIGYFTDIEKTEAFTEIAPVFITFALIFILFEGVLNVDLKELLVGIVQGSSLSFFSFLLSMIIVGLVMILLGWGIWESLLLGAILGDSAQAVIIPLLKKIKASQDTGIILTFESAISDIFCIVGALTIINIILLKEFSIQMVLQKILYSFVFAIIIGIAVAVLWISLLPHFNKFSKSYMTTIAVLVILYAVCEKLGGNGALACLSFGIVVGNSKKIYSALHKTTNFSMEESARFFYSQISFFLKTFFFVYLGIIINLGEYMLLAIGASLAILLFVIARPVAVAVSQRKSGLDRTNKTYLEVLNPKGLSAAVLAQLPLQYGINRGEMFPTIVMTSIIASVLLSLFGVYVTEKGKYKGIFSLFKKGEDMPEDKKKEEEQKKEKAEETESKEEKIENKKEPKKDERKAEKKEKSHSGK